ncbi:hypothetical protein DENSPDRAFT_450217 [Dentipellis sp. KUC8613]|nr:hypothetical protein DENSPDRAFT_450217 [Dentipellis sp. KUC8613]
MTKPPPILPTAPPLVLASPPASPLSGLASSPVRNDNRDSDIIEISSPSIGVVGDQDHGAGEKRGRSPISAHARSKRPRLDGSSGSGSGGNTPPANSNSNSNGSADKAKNKSKTKTSEQQNNSAPPSTPLGGAVPTLTELLASSKRPCKRPSQRLEFTPSQETAGGATDGGAGKDGDGGQDKGKAPARPVSQESRAASPSLLLGADFTHDPAAFAPPFTSTQQQQLSQPQHQHQHQHQRPEPFPGGAVGVGNGLAPTSSGFFGMGYDSQFDVEGGVDRVSELLERDVDFGAWLRDVPAEEG